MRTRIYVDGFNLYYGALKETEFKWLDLVELSRQALPSSCVVDRVKYFTARVSGAFDRKAPRNQQVYFMALKTLPEVEIHASRFISKPVWMPLLNLPVAGKSIRTPDPVALPAGNHAVNGLGTLPVGGHGTRRRGRRRAGTPDRRAMPWWWRSTGWKRRDRT